MENQSTTSYTFTHRLKGETRLELFEQYYLQIHEKKLGRPREFKLELAILKPEPLHIQANAIHWLAAAIAAGLSALYFVYLLFSPANGDLLWPTLSAAGAALLLSGAFGALFAMNSERKWVLETRAALYPLVEISPTVKRTGSRRRGLHRNSRRPSK